jgi:hypothetical protein
MMYPLRTSENVTRTRVKGALEQLFRLFHKAPRNLDFVVSNRSQYMAGRGMFSNCAELVKS